eukprot:TRINITY_DN406_c0_g5_i1.p1 TRINITY_DN406_c0_g5~~TRINITY_DN406_c0_g5_i1.p1  ORF type:complete len:217 (-),score=78.09 TRINITY_DN406_c0_g5_i1:179-829(-)
MMSPAMSGDRRRRSSSLLLGGALAAALATYSGLNVAFSMGGNAAGRREFLASSAAAAGLTAATAPSLAAELPFLGRQRGPFEMDPKEAVIVADSTTENIKAARKKVQDLQDQAEDALAKLEKDEQTDLAYMFDQFGIADLREATNQINNLMDSQSAAGTQRLQRLMIQDKYRFEDDLPFPTDKTGKPLARGPKRAQRMKNALVDYINNSKELLKFF